MIKLPPIDIATCAAIREGLAQADRGEFAPDKVIKAADERHGIDQIAKRRLVEAGPKNLMTTKFGARLRKSGE